MTDRETLYAKLVELLTSIDFDRRYYDFYLSHRQNERKSMPGASQKDYEAALAITGLDFKYVKKDRFFSHIEKWENGDVGLKVAFPHSTVELILSVGIKDEKIGGPFPKLAREIGQRRDPDFSPSPASPKLPFSNEDELREAVRFGVSLFEDAKQVILSHKDWDS